MPENWVRQFDVWADAVDCALARARRTGRRTVVWRCLGMWRVAVALRQTRGPWSGALDRSSRRERSWIVEDQSMAEVAEDR